MKTKTLGIVWALAAMIFVAPVAWKAAQGPDPATSRIVIDAGEIYTGAFGSTGVVRRHVRQVDADGRWMWLGTIERLSGKGNWYGNRELRRTLDVDRTTTVQAGSANEMQDRLEVWLEKESLHVGLGEWTETVFVTMLAGVVSGIFGLLLGMLANHPDWRKGRNGPECPAEC